MATVAESLGPPRTHIGAVGWVRKNLFNTWYNALLTVISLWVIYGVITQLAVWVVTGARWAVISANLRLFMVGPYPPDQVWRVWAVVIVVSVLMGLSAGVWGGDGAYVRYLAGGGVGHPGPPPHGGATVASGCSAASLGSWPRMRWGAARCDGNAGCLCSGSGHSSSP